MPVELTTREEFAVLTLNRPEVLNALSFEVVAEIGAAIDAVAGMDVRALLITGAGEKAFCAGADISELSGRSVAQEWQGAINGQGAFAKLDRLPIASVAVINGYAFGGGLELALASTFRLATANARMGLPEIKLGLIPGYGGTQRLPRLIGEGRALELIMTGRTVKPDEALAIGLVHRLVEGDPIEAAMAFAREFTCYSLPALQIARTAVSRGLDAPVHEGMKTEADLSALVFQLDDAAEGMAAFQEKRQASFKDR